MPVTSQDLAEFHRFAEHKLSNGSVDSIEQLAHEWSEARESDEVVQDIVAGEAEIAAGGGRPAAEVIDEIHDKMSSR